MSKKSFAKIISTILVFVLCVGVCFVGTVAAQNKTAKYTIAGDTYFNGAQFATAKVTFTSEDAFIAGRFTVNSDSALDFYDASVVSAVQNGTVVYPKVYSNINNNKVLFQGFSDSDTQDMSGFTSITLLLKFVPNGIQTGKEYNVSLSNVEITDEESVAIYGATGTVESKIHIHTFADNKCTFCGYENIDVEYDPNGDYTKNDLVGNAGENVTTVTFATDGSIDLNLWVAKNKIDSVTSNGERIFFVYVDVDGNVDYILTKGTDIVNGTESYLFNYTYSKGVKAIADGISGNFIVVDSSNKIVSCSDTITASVKDYCYYVLKGDYTDLEKDYCEALLNYAAAAQIFTDYKADDLANAQLEANGFVAGYPVATDLPQTTTAEIKNGEGANWSVPMVNVSLDIKPTIRFAFSFEDGVNYKNAVITFESASVKKTISGDKLIAFRYDSSIYYRYDLSEIPAKALREDITITVEGSDKQVIYGIPRYVKARNKNGAQNAKDVCNAMLNYSDALKAAFN